MLASVPSKRDSV